MPGVIGLDCPAPVLMAPHSSVNHPLLDFGANRRRRYLSCQRLKQPDGGSLSSVRFGEASLWRFDDSDLRRRRECEGRILVQGWRWFMRKRVVSGRERPP
jgi:hypothetical protein